MYDYYEAVKESVLNYIKENLDMENIDFDELEEELTDKLLNEDSVTGNASGSYTFCRAEAQEYVESNKDLVREMCYEFCNEQETMQWWLNDDYELIDVSLRCFVLGAAINEALKELKESAE